MVQSSSSYFPVTVTGPLNTSIDPTEVIPDSKCNPAIFVQGSVSSSKVDEIVDDRNQVNTNMSVKNMKIIIDERPGRQ